MILVTGGTGLVAHLLLYLIESESLGVEIRANLSKTKSLFEFDKLSLFDAIELLWETLLMSLPRARL
jgi:hypothetical protein